MVTPQNPDSKRSQCDKLGSIIPDKGTGAEAWSHYHDRREAKRLINQLWLRSAGRGKRQDDKLAKEQAGRS